MSIKQVRILQEHHDKETYRTKGSFLPSGTYKPLAWREPSSMPHLPTTLKPESHCDCDQEVTGDSGGGGTSTPPLSRRHRRLKPPGQSLSGWLSAGLLPLPPPHAWTVGAGWRVRAGGGEGGGRACAGFRPGVGRRVVAARRLCGSHSVNLAQVARSGFGRRWVPVACVGGRMATGLGVAGDIGL